MNHADDPVRVVILGTGGNSVDILDTIHDINRVSGCRKYECIGFLDDSERRWGKTVAGVPILGSISSAREISTASFVNGIGSDRSYWQKEAIIEKAGVGPDRFVTIIHPTASVSSMCSIGRGVVVLQHVTIASNVTIGNHVIILPGTILSHDDVVDDYSTIAGGVVISGNVRVGRSCYLGSNSSIISNVEIGDYALVGMGSVVLADVRSNTVVVGNPARFLRDARPVGAAPGAQN